MFVSTDTEGRVLVNIVENVAFGMKTSKKIIVIDPKRDLESISFPVLACKFYESKYP